MNPSTTPTAPDESGSYKKGWIPAFAGMTVVIARFIGPVVAPFMGRFNESGETATAPDKLVPVKACPRHLSGAGIHDLVSVPSCRHARENGHPEPCFSANEGNSSSVQISGMDSRFRGNDSGEVQISGMDSRFRGNDSGEVVAQERHERI